MTLRTVTGLTTVVCLSGVLGPETGPELERELRRQLGQAGLDDRRLVLDLAGVSSLSQEARATLQRVTEHLAHAPVLAVGAAPAVRAVLERTEIPGIRLHDTLAGALAALAAPAAGERAVLPREATGLEGEVFGLQGEVSGLQGELFGLQGEVTGLQGEVFGLQGEVTGLQGEVFGLRARARTRTLIGVAQGILMARYALSGPAAAFVLLREGSQHHNVPLRILASAVVTAPAPRSDARWFAGRPTRVPPPATALLHTYGIDAHDRRQVLTAALHEAVGLAGVDAAELHLADPAQDDALMLEQHHGLGPAYRDQAALVLGPPYVCARAQARGAAVTVPDIAADPALPVHPAGRALLAAGSRALHCVPLIAAEGYCTGALTLHWAKPGSWLTAEQDDALDVLAAEIELWRSWYRRTVVLDALEYLHQHRGPDGTSRPE
ncbi:ANTAR domain-containing protein [Streptomyces sp. NPDC005423]|uniref:ANTAR domain-containing protein n=1 Tax=Streptomyces sp. NPDC005423 TaxID=3155343 RepID=UPI0033B48F2B